MTVALLFVVWPTQQANPGEAVVQNYTGIENHLFGGGMQRAVDVHSSTTFWKALTAYETNTFVL